LYFFAFPGPFAYSPPFFSRRPPPTLKNDPYFEPTNPNKPIEVLLFILGKSLVLLPGPSLFHVLPDARPSTFFPELDVRHGMHPLSPFFSAGLMLPSDTANLFFSFSRRKRNFFFFLRSAIFNSAGVVFLARHLPTFKPKGRPHPSSLVHRAIRRPDLFDIELSPAPRASPPSFRPVRLFFSRPNPFALNPVELGRIALRHIALVFFFFVLCPIGHGPTLPLLPHPFRLY